MSSTTIEAPATSGKPTQARNALDKAQRLLDARIKRIKKDILSESPYILSAENSLRSAYIRHIHPNNFNGWRKHTNFSETEKPLQYLTFKDRSRDMSVSGMHAHGGWDDGKGGIAAQEGKASLASSDAATPHINQQGPKKKITLADYKNKDRSKATPVQGSKALASELGKVAVVAVKPEVPATTAPDTARTNVSEQHGTKRSADTMTATNEPQTLEAPLKLPLAKKARTTPEPDSAIAKTLPKSTPPRATGVVLHNDANAELLKVPLSKVPHDDKSPQSEAQSLKVKLKLSKIEKTAPHGLPSMLSPLSLPSDVEADIEEELTKRTPTPSLRGDVSSAEKPKASKDSVNGTPSSNEKPTTSKVVQKTTPKNAFTSSKGPQELKGVTSAPRPGNKDLGLERAIASKPNSNGTPMSSASIIKTPVPEAPRKLRRRITIRIKKKTNRKILGQYLSLKPTPGKYPAGMQLEARAEVARSEVKQHDDKDSQNRTESEVPKASEKRRRLQEDEDENENEPPVKRQKAPGGLQHKTHTPKQSSISSPALSHLGSAQKPHLSTPELGLTSTPMMRAGSGGSSVHTPRQLAMNGTPVAPGTGNSRASSHLASASKPKAADLSSEAKKYTRIGVDLKHDADRFFKKPGDLSDADRKQGVIFGIESVLCFMLSFALSEVGMQNGDRTSWKSILPFLAKVNEEAKGFRHLSGLALQIESVIRDILVHIDFQRLNRNPLDDYFNKEKAIDAAKSKEQNKAAEYALQFADLRHNSDKAQSLSRASWAYLNLEEISTKFSNTWAKREDVRPPIGKGPEVINVGDYQRTFTLPVSSTTSKLEAVNFGISVLVEFCQNEGVDFTPKIVL
ncbi:hypothetical protein P7C71_g1342, partial [Lecanoromycetidae sp. Uapishka_2]